MTCLVSHRLLSLSLELLSELVAAPLGSLVAHAFDQDIIPDGAWIVGNGLLFRTVPLADTWHLSRNFLKNPPVDSSLEAGDAVTIRLKSVFIEKLGTKSARS